MIVMTMCCLDCEPAEPLEPFGKVNHRGEVTFGATLRCPRCDERYHVNATLGRLPSESAGYVHHGSNLQRGQRVA